eukprot:6580961-Alexandrium_andersonii.AAC.1
MDYGILTTASVLYRRWVAMRLRSLSGWAAEWRLPEMFGPTKGRAADAACRALSLETEVASTVNEGISALSLDIFKCFDQ